MGARIEQEMAFGSLVAAADLSTKKHYLVKVTAANTANLCGAGECVAGVLMNDPASGEPCKVSVGVVCPVVAGGVVAAGAALSSDASGRAVTATVGTYIFAIALEAAGAAGREFAALMVPQQASYSADVSAVSVGIAAAKTITVDHMVCLDADGYLVDAADATAVSFWGFALETVDNSGGADGAEVALIRRIGLVELTGAGLVDTDVGKECWVTNATTITTTPGNVLVGIIESIASATEPTVRIKPLPIVGQRTDRQHVISFSAAGATLDGTTAFTDREFKRKYIPLSMMIDAGVAPAGASVLTATLTDATNTYIATITGAAVHGENKTPAPLAASLKANFDTDLTLADTGATTADVSGEILVEDL